MADAQLLRTTRRDQRRTPDGRARPSRRSRQGDRVRRLPPRLCRGQRRSRRRARRPGDAAAEARPSATCARADRLAGADLAALAAKGHETAPPARYTDASLVKRLEEDGIGRPSTYAPIISTIERRGYVSRQGKALVPSFTAFAVTRLLQRALRGLVDLGFTGQMEEILDEISNGRADWLDFLDDVLQRRRRATAGLETLVQGKEQAIDYPVIDLGDHPESGKPVGSASAATARSCSWASRPTTHDRVGPRRDRARPISASTTRSSCSRPRPKGRRRSAHDPATGLPVYVMHRPLRPLRPARRDAREGQQGQAEAGLARPRGCPRTRVTLDRGAPAAVAAARARRDPTPARRSSPTAAASGRT